MVRRSVQAPNSADEADGRPARSRGEIVSIRKAHEILGDARCPLCRARLVARYGRKGPYFFCRCLKKRAA